MYKTDNHSDRMILHIADKCFFSSSVFNFIFRLLLVRVY